MVELGVFLPVISSGWVVSTAAPQYQPSYEMNRAMALLAEDLGFRFVLSPVKYRGFGGPTEQWDYTLESFEVMAALARPPTVFSSTARWHCRPSTRPSPRAAPRRSTTSPMAASGSTWCPGGRRMNTSRWDCGPAMGITNAATSITPIIASYAQCAAILDRIGAVPGTKGIMLILPECLEGLQVFGERVLPRMRTAKPAPPRPPRRHSVPLMTPPREHAYA